MKYIFLALMACSAYAQTPVTLTLAAPSTPVLPGGTAQVSVTINSQSGSEPAGVQFTVNWSADVVSVAVVAGPAATAAAKTLSCGQPSAGALTCLLTGMNSNVIANGTLATVAVTVSQWVSAPSVSLSGLVSASVAGNSIATGGGLAVIIPVGVQQPAAPTVNVSTAMPANTGVRILVHAGGDLQAAISSAQCGDWIILDAGAEWSGNFTASRSCAAGTGVVVKSAGSLPVPGNRVAPANAAQLATISTPNTGPALKFSLGASGWRFTGIEFKLAAGNTGTYYMVCMGASCDGVTSQNDTNRPNHLLLDRVYVHGDGDYTHSIQHGVALQCDYCGVIDSYLENIWGRLSSDSQAIFGTDGRGPFLIRNSHIEGASENVDFGGAMPTLTGVTPSDLTMTGNDVVKPLTWRGRGLNVKNLLEFKSMRRALVDGNVFENCWAEGQAGTAIMFTVRTGQSGSSATVSDVTFSNNLVRNASSGLEMTGFDDEDPSHGTQQGNRLLAQNNLFYGLDSSTYGGDGRQFQFYNTVANVTLRHNTTDSTTIAQESGFGPLAGYSAQDNIANYGVYGIQSASTGLFGTSAFNSDFAPGWSSLNNVLFGYQSGTYPPNNFYPPTMAAVGFTDPLNGDYALQSTSPYRLAATDGKDIGVDMAALNLAIANVISGQTSASAPAPAPAPAPSGPVSISGRVTSLSQPLAGVTVTLSAAGSTTTAADGSYAITVPSGYTGTAMPSANGFTFAPVFIGLMRVAANAVSQNFSGTDVQAPAISITSPAASATLPRANVTLACAATDNWAVRQVVWSVDGTAIGTATAAPFALAWNPSAIKGKGWHTLSATATDAAGNSTTAVAVQFRVN